MKYSLYNVIIEDSAGTGRWLWNTYSDHVVRLDDDAYAFIRGFRASSPFPSGSIYEGICIGDGFIVSDDTDETDEVLLGYERDLAGEDTDEIRLTVAPGMGCNYDCTYCFEKGRRSSGKMTDAIVKTICRRIAEKLETDTSVRILTVTWFGGEPLMYRDVIHELSGILREICEEHKVLYRSAMITNGRFLDRKTAEELKSDCVSKLQISMDGTVEDYCREKGASKEDFDAVVSNISGAWDLLDITVRINIPDHDVGKALDLAEYLLRDKGLDGKIRVYPAFIRDGDAGHEAETESYRDYLKMDREFRSLFDGKTFSENSLALRSVRRISSPCSQVCANTLLIGPRGELYGCEHCFGDASESIGSITDAQLFGPKGYSPVLPKEDCLECPFLPCCMGGCPRDARNGFSPVDCDGLRERLTDLKRREILKTERIL